MPHYIHTRLGENRRGTISAQVCTRLGLVTGESLVIEENGDSLWMGPRARLLRDMQAAFAPYRTISESLVDELIAERRARRLAKTRVSSGILDAAALPAFLFDETGVEVVTARLLDTLSRPSTSLELRTAH